MRPYTRADAEADLAAAVEAGELSDALAAASALDNMGRPAPASLVGAALWYAERAVPVFPLQPGAKIPYQHSRGVSDATADAAKVAAWWRDAPDSNIGLATGHRFDVLDIDGPDGNATLARDVLDAPTPDQPYHGLGYHVFGVVSTPRPGGRHLYVAARPGARNKAGMGGIDYRGRGGYVVAPPSRLDERPGQHPGPYVWVRPLLGGVA